jgi:hypothetical protein
VTDDGIVIEVKPEHSINADLFIDLVVEGIKIEVKF